MPGLLEVNLDPAQLYLGSGLGTNPNRPLFTADVFERQERKYLVVEHPCSMRAGVALADSVLVAPVKEHAPLNAERWANGYYGCFPLPNLTGDGHLYVAALDAVERCATAQLQMSDRISCMLPIGVNLFQQRFVWYLTRCLIATSVFDDAFGRYYEEADAIEEWVEEAVALGVEVEEASKDANEALSTNANGSHQLRELLSERQQRSFVRKEMRRLCRARYAA